MNNQEYETSELKRFNSQSYSFFDNVKDFSDTLETMDIKEQIEWIENGSYGAGTCLALHKTFDGLTNRMNKNARVGQIVLHALYGMQFKQWGKLSDKAKKRFDRAITVWMKQKHKFAI